MLRLHLTIRRKLILSIGVPLLVTYLGLLAWDYVRQRSLTVQQMQQTVLERAESTAARLDTRLASAVHAADSLATQFESPMNRSDRQVRSVLAGAMRLPWMSAATITFEPTDGAALRSVTLRHGNGPLLPNRERAVIDAVAPAWHERVKQSRSPGWTDPIDVATGDGDPARPCVTYVEPIVADNVFAGSAAVTVDVIELRRFRGGFGGPGPGGPPRDGPSTVPSAAPSNDFRAAPRGGHRPDAAGPMFDGATSQPAALTDALRREASAAASGELDDYVVFDSRGRLILAPSAGDPPPNETLFDTAARLNQPEMADAARSALAGQSKVVRVAGLKQVVPSVPDDTHHWLAMAPVSSAGWLLVSAVPESANLSPVLDRLLARAAFLAGGLVVMMLVVFAVAVGLSRPIEQLAAAVDRVAAGDFNAAVQSRTTTDELGRLTSGFNNMTRTLRSQIEALTAQTAAREKVESELRIARQIQMDLLPKAFPARPDFALHAINLPALHVAGDFYDFFFTPAGLLTLVIADVSGKGVPAALLMAVTRTVVRNLAQAGQSPLAIAEATNRTLLSDTSASMFVTMLLCQYDPVTGRLTYVNAGHPPALKLGGGHDPVEVCAIQSPLLGVDVDGSLGAFEQGEEHVGHGETLFLYTDGVSESRGADGNLLQTSGIIGLLKRSAGEMPNALCRRASEQLERLGSGSRADDITMLALRRL